MSWLKGILVYGGLAIIEIVQIQTFILSYNFLPQIINAFTVPWLGGLAVVFGAYQVD